MLLPNLLGIFLQLLPKFLYLLSLNFLTLNQLSLNLLLRKVLPRALLNLLFQLQWELRNRLLPNLLDFVFLQLPGLLALLFLALLFLAPLLLNLLASELLLL